MTKGRAVFRVLVERFDVGAVPVPVFGFDQFGGRGHVQVGQDERIPVHIIELPFQRPGRVGPCRWSAVSGPADRWASTQPGSGSAGQYTRCRRPPVSYTHLTLPTKRIV